MTTGQQPHMRVEKGNAQEEDQGHDGNKLENMSQLDQRPWKETGLDLWGRWRWELHAF